MNQQKLAAFIQQIIRTSPDQNTAKEALEELRGILVHQVPEKELKPFSAAEAGIADSFDTMKNFLKDARADAGKLREAAEQAKRERERMQREQEERDRMYGRC